MTDQADPKPIDLELLLRYVADGVAPDEAAAVAAWRDADNHHRRALAVLARMSGTDSAELPLESDGSAVWRRIAAGMRAGRAALALHGPKAAAWRGLPGRRAPIRRAARLAAAAAITLMAGLTSWYLARQHELGAGPARSAPAREYVTRRGERATLRLPDGTRVMLDAESKLRLPAEYGIGSRDVGLSGQAYFDVVHDPKRPFRVRTAHAIAHDLGTVFVVRAYPGDTATDVAVASGRVAVGRPVADPRDSGRMLPAGAEAAPRMVDSLIVTRGQLARVADGGTLALRRGIALDTYLGWTEGRLVFRDTPLREAVAQLARWYDVQVELKPSSLGSRALTASFDQESAEAALETMAVSLGLRLSRRDGRFVLTSR